MERVDLKCPNCHANVESDDGMISYTCPCCHSKLELIHQDDDSLKVIISKISVDPKKESLNSIGDKTSMELFSLRCPHCDAELEPEDWLVTYICPYCKSRLLLDKQSDGTLKARLALKQMEHARYQMKHESEEREKEFHRERIRTREKLLSDNTDILFFAGIIVFLLIAWVIIEIANGALVKKVYVPYNASYFMKLNWEDSKEILEEAGFTDISCIEIDKMPGLLHKAGQVYGISIAGDTKFKAQTRYFYNAPVIINYYPDD